MDFGGYLLCSRFHIRHGAQSKMKCFIPKTALAYVFVFPCSIIDESSFNAGIRELYPAFSHENLGIAWLLSIIYSLWSSPERVLFFFFNKYLFCFVFFFFCGSFLKSLLNLLQYWFSFMFWLLGPKACRILAYQPGFKPIPHALEGELLTTGLPGKSQRVLSCTNKYICEIFLGFSFY